jgi:hypothetical protein
MSYEKTCLICGLPVGGFACQPCFEAGRYSEYEMRQIRKYMAPDAPTFHGIPIDYGDFGVIQTEPQPNHWLSGFDGFRGFGFDSAPATAVAVRTGPCSHKWGPWKACGGRFDHRGPIETLYSRWCSLCREGEETRTADRL